jgi:hypothetical protein
LIVCSAEDKSLHCKRSTFAHGARIFARPPLRTRNLVEQYEDEEEDEDQLPSTLVAAEGRAALFVSLRCMIAVRDFHAPWCPHFFRRDRRCPASLCLNCGTGRKDTSCSRSTFSPEAIACKFRRAPPFSRVLRTASPPTRAAETVTGCGRIGRLSRCVPALGQRDTRLLVRAHDVLPGFPIRKSWKIR